MNSLANIVLPVFGLMAIGYFAAWTRLLPEAVVAGLMAYVTRLAVPLLVFAAIARSSLPDASPWALWGAYFSASAIVWALGALIARHLFREDWPKSGLIGAGCAYSNSMLIALPLVLTTFGEAGAVPLFVLLSIHAPLMLFAATVIGELSTGSGAPRLGATVMETALAVLFNPVIIGIFAGMAWRFTGLSVPGFAANIIQTVGDTAVPCALVAMGLSLRGYGLLGEWKLTSLIVFMKLIVHPAMVFVMANAFGLPPLWAGVAVLTASVPSAVMVYMVGSRYQIAVAAVSGAILLGSGLALVTCAAVVQLIAS